MKWMMLGNVYQRLRATQVVSAVHSVNEMQENDAKIRTISNVGVLENQT